MTNEEKDKIARNAASEWSKCFKCDGVVNGEGVTWKCKKPGETCHKWYDGFRTAKIALDKSALTWKDLCLICETAFGMLGRNINEDLMGKYDSPKEFYEELKKKLNG